MNNRTSLRFRIASPLLLLAMTVLLSLPALAEEYTYAPDGCEFQITFPGEPYTATRCDPDAPSKCNKITSYTEVIDMAATLNFNITCNPADEGMYDAYSGDIMRATLAAMARSRNLEQVETHLNETDEYRHALLLAAGTAGASTMLYSTHLMIGKKSVFTVEAELIGDTPPQAADELFSTILQSIKPVSETTEKKDESASTTQESSNNAQESSEHAP